METTSMIESKREFLENVFRNIDERNKEAINAILEEKREFNERINKVVNKVRFRNKIDKIKAGVKFTISKEQIKEIDDLTKATREKLIDKALKMSNGNEKKAISLLFDPSSNIEI